LDGIGPIQRDHLVISKEHWLNLRERTIAEVQAYLALNTLRRGIPKEQLKNRLKLSKGFSAILLKLETEDRLKANGPFVTLPGHEVHFTPRQQVQVEKLIEQFAREPYSPPSIKDCHTEVGEELYNAMVEMGLLVPVSNEVVFREVDYRFLIDEISQIILNTGSITVALFRDRFKTSRRYGLAFLEHLDQAGITIRDGDFRRLR
jgi:selenocysteine-specific elongation factor